jgi:hypothetical protein
LDDGALGIALALCLLLPQASQGQSKPRRPRDVSHTHGKVSSDRNFNFTPNALQIEDHKESLIIHA